MVPPVPAAIESLVALLRASPTMAGVRVEDGPLTTGVEEPDAVGVGLETEDADVASSELRPGLRGAHDEMFDLVCVAQSWNGDGDLTAARRRVFQVLDAVADVLAADRDLGLPGQVLSAALVRTAYVPDRFDGGVLARAPFVVQVRAYRR